MTPVFQVMVGVGLGLVGVLLLTPLLYAYTESHYGNRRPRKNKTDFFTPPGHQCPICLESMEGANMQYLSCGHAMHDQCFRESRIRLKQCPICRGAL